MFQFLPMLAGLLQGSQKQAEQQKQDKVGAMLGQAPLQGGGQQGGGGAAGIMGMAGKMMGGMGGKSASQESGGDMLQGLYGDAGNAPGDEDLLSMGTGPKQGHEEPDVDDFLR